MCLRVSVIDGRRRLKSCSFVKVPDSVHRVMHVFVIALAVVSRFCFLRSNIANPYNTIYYCIKLHDIENLSRSIIARLLCCVHHRLFCCGCQMSLVVIPSSSIRHDLLLCLGWECWCRSFRDLVETAFYWATASFMRSVTFSSSMSLQRVCFKSVEMVSSSCRLFREPVLVAWWVWNDCFKLNQIHSAVTRLLCPWWPGLINKKRPLSARSIRCAVMQILLSWLSAASRHDHQKEILHSIHRAKRGIWCELNEHQSCMLYRHGEYLPHQVYAISFLSGDLLRFLVTVL